MKTSLQTIIFILSILCTGQAAQAQDYLLREAYPNVQFNNQLEGLIGNNGSRLYIVEQGGRIYWLPTNNTAITQATLFLDITSRVVSGGERGLLGLAFHPDFQSNGYFYVNYTTGSPLQTRISRFTATTATTADPNSELVLLTYNQPFDNHNGGKIAFGPDGFLYISAGDGGSGGDPQNNAQSRASLLGKIHRIDVNNPSGGRNYGIPANNPFAGNTAGYREEIFAYGLRNVWKFSFDTETNRLFAGDVGQSSREEINLITSGGNYGWRIMEGTACHNPPSGCNTAGLILPIFDYTHASGAGRTITGGFVYRGTLMPELLGKYIYGDYISGNIWALTLNQDGTAAGNTLLLNAGFLISSFAEDENKELLVLSYGSGREVYRLSSSAVTGAADELDAALEIYPNPASTRLHIRFDSGYVKGLHQEIFLHNAVGQEVSAEAVHNTTREAVLQVGDLPRGVYHIHIRTNRGSLWRRVVLR